ncbi:MAG TPA: very short patch repair endonuclease [Dysgonomonas sp.]|uniref:very short patch repair endonuclease n=1 Tax=unclassified Dysgonomonas TaxID=2630389 RepID=UPI0025C6DA03|nr:MULTISPECIES: very short patch repair endonuclease [unclassified Dysgonomonas]HML66458.1 very short patch repair endonuclease [Dysgonomonas sp.]
MEKIYIRDRRFPIPQNELTSKIMSSIKAKDTKLELILRRYLWEEGIKGCRIHWRKAQGRPDIAFLKKKLAIFVNGCFWHRCPYCISIVPKTNSDFWEHKFTANIERDYAKQIELENMGWIVITIWKYQIKKDLSSCVCSIKEIL